MKERQNLIKQLIIEFKKQSNTKTKAWFDNYLKGAIAYRGLKTPQVSYVEGLFRKYIQQLNKEVIDRHTKHLDCHKELRQLKRNLLTQTNAFEK